MTVISVENAKREFDKLVDMASAGEEIILTQDEHPVARMVSIPAAETAPIRKPGSAKDSILHMADDFDAPLEDFQEYMQ